MYAHGGRKVELKGAEAIAALEAEEKRQQAERCRRRARVLFSLSFCFRFVLVCFVLVCFPATPASPRALFAAVCRDKAAAIQRRLDEGGMPQRD